MGLTAIPDSGAFVRRLRLLACVLAGVLWLVPGAGRAQDWPNDAAAAPEFFGELPEPDTTLPAAPVVLADGPMNVFVAIHRTRAQRYSDTYLTNGQKRRRSVAASMRLRRQDGANFTRRHGRTAAPGG